MNRAFIKGELQGCIEDLKNGELHEKRLQAIVDYVESSGPQATGSAVPSSPRHEP